MLTLTYGNALDGVIPRDPVGEASAGDAWVGPRGLIERLETLLGLPRVAAAEPLRIAVFLRRIETTLESTPFYADSWKMDPWAVARTLLDWRDQLVSGGWRGEPIPNGGPRLEALRAIDALDAPVLPPGFADRIQRVAEALDGHGLAGLRQIRLAEPRAHVTPPTARIVDLLESAGVEIVEPTVPTGQASADTDLGVLQRALLAGAAPEGRTIRGDGSLTLLTAPSSRLAAQSIAAALSARPRSDWPLDLGIVRGLESDVLDQALVAHGLGSLGSMSTSPWRPALQLLPLLLAQLWGPTDPQRMLELLSLEVSPLSRRLRFALMRALERSPGVGGPTWDSAWRKVAEEAEDASVVEGQVATWLVTPAYEPKSGAPKEAIIDLASRLADWCERRGRASVDDPVQADTLATAAAQARQLAEIVADWGEAQISRPDLDQLLDAVTRAGSTRRLYEPLSGSPAVFDDPGALVEPHDTVVWWGFVASAAARPDVTAWRQAERAALEAAGISLVDPLLEQRARGAAWVRPLLRANKHLVLVRFESVQGEPEGLHPVWDEIEGRLDLSGPELALLTVEWDRPLTQPEAGAILGADVARRTIEPDAPTRVTPIWNIPPELLAPRAQESASSLERLFKCPTAWTFQYPASIKARGIPTLPDGPRLCGNFGHRLIEGLLGAATLPDPSEAERIVGERFDEAVRTDAAMFLQPGNRETLEDFRHRIVRAGSVLLRAISAGGYTVEGCEVAFEGVPFAGTPLGGAVDLLLSHPVGGRVIVDLKWSGYRFRHEMLAKGRAVQLALYAHAFRRKGSAKLPRTAFYILNEAKFLTVSPALFEGAVVVDGASMEETLAAAEDTYRETREDFARGIVVAPELLPDGDPESERRADYPLQLTEGCTYCDYDSLCGLTEEAR